MNAVTATLPEYYNVGSFWTHRQRQAHSLNEISYRACFKPQLPAYFIDRLTTAGDVVLDPFMGRGTTALQAALSGRVAYGSDINPLSIMLALPRLTPPTLREIKDRFAQIPDDCPITNKDKDLLVFYHPSVLRHLLALKKWFGKNEKRGTMTNVDRWIRMIVLNRLSGHSTGFLSVRTMPPNQAVSVESQKKINLRNKQSPEQKNVFEIVMKKSKSLLRSGYPPTGRKHKLCCGNADNLQYIEDNQVDLAVTSPPFLDIVDYAKDNWLRCWFAGINTNNMQIDNHKTPDKWRQFIRRVFTEFARVVKPGGHVAFEVGEVRNGTIQLEHHVLEAIRSLPFDLMEIIVNKQGFTKTSNCWGVKNNIGGTLTNRIVLVKRHGG